MDSDWFLLWPPTAARDSRRAISKSRSRVADQVWGQSGHGSGLMSFDSDVDCRLGKSRKVGSVGVKSSATASSLFAPGLVSGERMGDMAMDDSEDALARLS